MAGAKNRSAALCLLGALLATGGRAEDVQVPMFYATTGADGKPQTVQAYTTAHIVLVDKEVQVKADDVAADFGRVPSQALATALQKYPDFVRFRLSWQASMFRSHDKCLVLYDREHRSLKYTCSSTFGDEDYSGISRRRYVLTGVTDRMLSQLAAAYGGNADTGGFTQFITRYGAKIKTFDEAGETIHGSDHGYVHERARRHYPPPAPRSRHQRIKRTGLTVSNKLLYAIR